MSQTFNRRTALASAAGAALALGLPSLTLAQSGARPVATTTHGKVRGVVEEGVNIFRGVRYGADTATTRFQAPRSPAPWTDVKEAVDYGTSAPQPKIPSDGGGLFGSWRRDLPIGEDCLFLNVWTPGLRDGRKRPIMVWLHGGGFASGNGSSTAYDGDRLARRGDVVVVTINHRLNAFGHLYLAEFGPEFADSGNVGILDIIHALRWVRDNAAEFGGDPSRVMIFGESGGGAKVSTLMAMDGARGLFHRAAVQSGAWLQVAEPAPAAEAAAAVVAKLGLDKSSIGRIREMPMAQIQAAVGAVAMAARGAGGDPLLASPGSGPVIDGRNLKRHPFSPDGPPQSRDVPLLIGINRTETSLLIGSRDAALFSLSWEALPGKLAPLLPKLDTPAIIAAYRKLHPQHSPSDVFFAATTDSRILRGSSTEAARKAAQGGAPAYFYMLDWDTPVDGGKWRAPHALEIGFVFDNVAKSESMSGVGPEQQRLADIMSATWLAFAHTGNPNNPAVPRWPRYDDVKRPTMMFSMKPQVVNNPHGAERRLFDALPMGTTG